MSLTMYPPACLRYGALLFLDPAMTATTSASATNRYIALAERLAALPSQERAEAIAQALAAEYLAGLEVMHASVNDQGQSIAERIASMPDDELEALMQEARENGLYATFEELSLVTKGSQGPSESDDIEYLRRRDDVPDDVLIARMNAAPDMGGSLLVELSEFAARRQAEQRFPVVAYYPLRRAQVVVECPVRNTVAPCKLRIGDTVAVLAPGGLPLDVVLQGVEVSRQAAIDALEGTLRLLLPESPALTALLATGEAVLRATPPQID